MNVLSCVTIQMKAFKQCCHVRVLSIMLHIVVFAFKFVDIERYFRVLLILLFKLVLSFILKMEPKCATNQVNSTEEYWG